MLELRTKETTKFINDWSASSLTPLEWQRHRNRTSDLFVLQKESSLLKINTPIANTTLPP
jgi:hypothetical protein